MRVCGRDNCNQRRGDGEWNEKDVGMSIWVDAMDIRTFVVKITERGVGGGGGSEEEEVVA